MSDTGPVRLLNLIGQLPNYMQMELALATEGEVNDRGYCKLCSVCKAVLDVPGHEASAHRAAKELLEWHNAVETGEPMWLRCRVVYGLAALWVDRRYQEGAA